MQDQDPAHMPQAPDGGPRRGGPSDPVAGPGSAQVISTDLRQNSLGLVGVTMQAITHIAPAIAALFFTQFIVSLAGITAPRGAFCFWGGRVRYVYPHQKAYPR